MAAWIIPEDEITVVSSFKIRLNVSIPPGEIITLRLEARRLFPGVGVFRGHCSMNGKTVAHASLAIAKAKLDKYVDVPW